MPGGLDGYTANLLRSGARVSGGGANRVLFQDASSLLATSANLTFSVATGQLALPTTGSGAGLLLGGDAQWYRSAADLMRTPDSLQVDGTIGIGTTPGAAVWLYVSKSVSDPATAAQYPLYLSGFYTSTDSTSCSVFNEFRIAAAKTTASGALNGIAVRPYLLGSYVSGAGVTNTGSLSGVYTEAYIDSASHNGTLATLNAYYANYGLGSGATGGGGITNVYGARLRLQRNGTGTMGTVYGLLLDQSGSGTVTTLWAIKEELVGGKSQLNSPIGLNVAPSLTAQLLLPAGTTGVSPLRWTSGVAPTSPVDGDMWFDGTDLKLRVSGATYTITKA